MFVRSTENKIKLKISNEIDKNIKHQENYLLSVDNKLTLIVI